EITSQADLGGIGGVFGGAPNPGGLLGQTWIATDVSNGPSRGNVYLLSSVDPPDGSDPLDIGFARSLDGGLTWEPPTIVNDDFVLGSWQWFGTLSVAPNGRIDAVWNDTRNTGLNHLSELYYAYSPDAGTTWSKNVRVGPIFNSHVGWPLTNHKLGDYYHMVSDDTGANLAYAATYNDEQDVYFLRIGFPDIDTDRDIDLRDFAGFQNCFSGEGGGVSEGCGLFDVDRDTDVDWTDYMGLSNLLVGP
ncbi:MAG: exo-alpha-sialidase, partial [Planctomycetes bacterium]|nr:exo-alpha-sialidase [Planctomycetota bacterium]